MSSPTSALAVSAQKNHHPRHSTSPITPETSEYAIHAHGPYPDRQERAVSSTFDMTGQVPPSGAKPSVTATLWEDEGTLCFQVETRGVCVARREDNRFINGTKLLNVAGMTRGLRDGILKGEKTRHVVKLGPMHLKGVWIPFERALGLANQEKITENLYPLFVHDIGALLYHPINQRGSVVTPTAMAALDQQSQSSAQNIPRYPQPIQSGQYPNIETAPHERSWAEKMNEQPQKRTTPTDGPEPFGSTLGKERDTAHEPWSSIPSHDVKLLGEKTSSDYQSPSSEASTHSESLEGNDLSLMVRNDVVNRLMDAFFDLFDDSMRESSDTSSEGETTSASTSDQGVTMSLDGSQSASHDKDNKQAPGDQEPTSSGANSRPNSSKSTARTVKKRRRSNSNAEQSDGQEGGKRDKRPRRHSTKHPDLLNALLRFACPFLKRFPDRPPKCASCVYPGFVTVHRLKEHLYRKHIRPLVIRCPRCYGSFDTEALLRSHARAAERCPEREEPAGDDGIDQEQERMLRSKKRLGRETSEEARWRQVFRICFPDVADEDIPSPYCDQRQPPAPHEFEQFEQFQRERLPQLVRRALEHAVMTAPQLAQLEESVRSQLVDIVRTCQDQVYEQYRHTAMTSAADPDGEERQRRNTPPELPKASDRLPPGHLGSPQHEAHPLPSTSSDQLNFLPSFNPDPVAMYSAPPETSHGMSLDELQALTSWSSFCNADSGYGGSGMNAVDPTSNPFGATDDMRQKPQYEEAPEWEDLLATLPNDSGEGPSRTDQQHGNNLQGDNGAGDPSSFVEEQDELFRITPFPNYLRD